MKSILNSLDVGPQSKGHILIDFDIIEFPFERRKTVVQMFGDRWPDKNNYSVVGIIKATNEYLIVPPEFATCTFGRSSTPSQRPPSNHVNNPALMEIINGPTSKAG